MINMAQVMGRVGRIETRPMNNGSNVTNISMVTSRKYVKDGEKIEKPTWHNITLYSKLSDIAEKYVGIGDLLYIQGEMEHQKFTGNDGAERVRSFILGHEIKLMPKGAKNQPQEELNDPIPF